jgi:hypothetical protein
MMDAYFLQIQKAINSLGFTKIKTCVYNVVPAIQKYNTHEDYEYPFLGTDGERKDYVLYCNKKIGEKCIEYGYIFFNIYNNYIDKNLSIHIKGNTDSEYMFYLLLTIKNNIYNNYPKLDEKNKLKKTFNKFFYILNKISKEIFANIIFATNKFVVITRYATKKHTALRTIRELRIDTVIGMLFSIVGSWFILVTTATVLHNNGVTNISTAADAAKALEPLVQTFPNAGVIAKAIFAIGVIGMGLLGIPVLAGSASYAVSETFGLAAGLDKKAWEAKGFYGVIVISTLVGFLMTLVGIDPIKALIFAAVINGLVAVPLILIIYGISSNEEIMGEYVGGKLSSRMLLITFLVMSICALALLISFIP